MIKLLIDKLNVTLLPVDVAVLATLNVIVVFKIAVTYAPDPMNVPVTYWPTAILENDDTLIVYWPDVPEALTTTTLLFGTNADTYFLLM